MIKSERPPCLNSQTHICTNEDATGRDFPAVQLPISASEFEVDFEGHVGAVLVETSGIRELVGYNQQGSFSRVLWYRFPNNRIFTKDTLRYHRLW